MGVGLGWLHSLYLLQTPIRYEASVGEKQVLVCAVTHATDFDWIKDTVVLQNSSPDGRVQIVNGSLVIRKVVLEDAATYTCQAGDAVSLVTTTVELKVICEFHL